MLWPISTLLQKGHVEDSSFRLAIDEQAIHDMDQCLTEFASTLLI